MTDILEKAKDALPTAPKTYQLFIARVGRLGQRRDVREPEPGGSPGRRRAVPGWHQGRHGNGDSRRRDGPAALEGDAGTEARRDPVSLRAADGGQQGAARS